MESDCNEDSPECYCPCGCGYQNDPNGGSLPFSSGIGKEDIIPRGEVGMCASCTAGVHELPPESVISIDILIAAHESCLRFLKEAKLRRHENNDS